MASFRKVGPDGCPLLRPHRMDPFVRAALTLQQLGARGVGTVLGRRVRRLPRLFRDGVGAAGVECRRLCRVRRVARRAGVSPPSADLAARDGNARPRAVPAFDRRDVSQRLVRAGGAPGSLLPSRLFARHAGRGLRPARCYGRDRRVRHRARVGPRSNSCRARARSPTFCPTRRSSSRFAALNSRRVPRRAGPGLRRLSRARLDGEIQRMRDDARSYRLIGAPTSAVEPVSSPMASVPRGDPERLLRSSVDQIHITVEFALRLVRRAVSRSYGGVALVRGRRPNPHRPRHLDRFVRGRTRSFPRRRGIVRRGASERGAGVAHGQPGAQACPVL